MPIEELWKTRVQLLTEDEREAMEALVKKKVEESKERILISWEAEKARQHLSSFLVTECNIFISAVSVICKNLLP